VTENGTLAFSRVGPLWLTSPREKRRGNYFEVKIETYFGFIVNIIKHHRHRKYSLLNFVR
jgi:hypothetical protein